MKLDLIHIESLISLTIRLVIDLGVTGILIFGIYKPSSNKKTFTFTLILFNLIIFIMGNLMTNIYLSFGSGLGLFAIFTMLRYRSETLNLKEMTYLFVLIATGFINAVGESISLVEIILLNGIIVGVIFCLERCGFCKSQDTKKIKYDNLELIRPADKEKLLSDIYNKTGILANDLIIESVNFSDNTASITLLCSEDGTPHKNGKNVHGKTIRLLDRTSIEPDITGKRIGHLKVEK